VPSGRSPRGRAPHLQPFMAAGGDALYGTTWENRASQGVVARLGLSMFGQSTASGEYSPERVGPTVPNSVTCTRGNPPRTMAASIHCGHRA
jgi:hypothetical protein